MSQRRLSRLTKTFVLFASLGTLLCTTSLASRADVFNYEFTVEAFEADLFIPFFGETFSAGTVISGSFGYEQSPAGYDQIGFNPFPGIGGISETVYQDLFPANAGLVHWSWSIPGASETFTHSYTEALLGARDNPNNSPERVAEVRVKDDVPGVGTFDDVDQFKLETTTRSGDGITPPIFESFVVDLRDATGSAIVQTQPLPLLPDISRFNFAKFDYLFTDDCGFDNCELELSGNIDSLIFTGPTPSGGGPSETVGSLETPALPDGTGCESEPCFGFGLEIGENGLGIESPFFIDPIVAIGYEYAIDTLLAPDIVFNSVVIPEQDGFGLGDPLELLVDGGIESLLVGTEFFFGAAVTDFIIQGIDPGLGLDPADDTAFITGLTFGGPGVQQTTVPIRVPMTMIPITVEVTAPTTAPEPQSLALTLVGLIAVMAARRRRT